MATKKRGTRKGAGGSGKGRQSKANTADKADKKPRGASKIRLLAALEKSPYHIANACAAAKVSRTSYYKWLDVDPVFAAEVGRLRAKLLDDLENNTMDRAANGWDEPVFYQGDECGTVRKFDNALSWKMLAKHRAETYREVKQDDARPTDLELGQMVTLKDCRENATLITLAMGRGVLPVAQGREMLAAVKEARESIAGEEFEARLAALEAGNP